VSFRIPAQKEPQRRASSTLRARSAVRTSQEVAGERHVHGHSHAGFGRQGKHFNVASARRRRAMAIDLETMRHTVVQKAES
jgi:hypothetical protein